MCPFYEQGKNRPKKKSDKSPFKVFLKIYYFNSVASFFVTET